MSGMAIFRGASKLNFISCGLYSVSFSGGLAGLYLSVLLKLAVEWLTFEGVLMRVCVGCIICIIRLTFMDLAYNDWLSLFLYFLVKTLPVLLYSIWNLIFISLPLCLVANYLRSNCADNNYSFLVSSESDRTLFGMLLGSLLGWTASYWSKSVGFLML